MLAKLLLKTATSYNINKDKSTSKCYAPPIKGVACTIVSFTWSKSIVIYFLQLTGVKWEERESEREFVHVSPREMLSNKAINFTCKKNYLSRKQKGNEKISELKATNTRQSMCSFIITPSILFRMLHTVWCVCATRWKQSGKTWFLDLGDAPRC